MTSEKLPAKESKEHSQKIWWYIIYING